MYLRANEQSKALSGVRLSASVDHILAPHVKKTTTIITISPKRKKSVTCPFIRSHRGSRVATGNASLSTRLTGAGLRTDRRRDRVDARPDRGSSMLPSPPPTSGQSWLAVRHCSDVFALRRGQALTAAATHHLPWAANPH